MWHDEDSEEPTFSDTLELDLGDVVPSLAGPKRPQDRISLDDDRRQDHRAARADRAVAAGQPGRGVRGVLPGVGPARQRRLQRARRADDDRGAETPGEEVVTATLEEDATPVTLADGTETFLDHGHVVIAAITSCTNTSNPTRDGRRRPAGQATPWRRA